MRNGYHPLRHAPSWSPWHFCIECRDFHCSQQVASSVKWKNDALDINKLSWLSSLGAGLSPWSQKLNPCCNHNFFFCWSISKISQKRKINHLPSYIVQGCSRCDQIGTASVASNKKKLSGMRRAPAEQSCYKLESKDRVLFFLSCFCGRITWYASQTSLSSSSSSRGGRVSPEPIILGHSSTYLCQTSDTRASNPLCNRKRRRKKKEKGSGHWSFPAYLSTLYAFSGKE